MSNVEDVTQQGEAHAPLGAVAGIDGGGTTVDAHDGAHHGLQVLVLEGDFLSAAEVVSGWLRGLGRLMLCCLGMHRRIGLRRLNGCVRQLPLTAFA